MVTPVLCLLMALSLARASFYLQSFAKTHLMDSPCVFVSILNHAVYMGQGEQCVVYAVGGQNSFRTGPSCCTDASFRPILRTVLSQDDGSPDIPGCAAVDQPCGVRFTTTERNGSENPVAQSRDFVLCRCASNTECPFDTSPQGQLVHIHRGRYKNQRSSDTRQTSTLIFCGAAWPSRRCRRKSGVTLTTHGPTKQAEIPSGRVHVHCSCPDQLPLTMHSQTRLQNHTQQRQWRFEYVCNKFKRTCKRNQEKCMTTQRLPDRTKTITYSCKCAYGSCKRRRAKSKCKESRILNYP